MIEAMSNTNGEKLWDEKNSIGLMKNNVSSQTNVECGITINTGALRDNVPLNDTIVEKVCGIYKIVNKVNGKYYVGSSNNIFGRRWKDHKHDLHLKRHYNKYLQRAWDKYGKSAFECIVVEHTSPTELLVAEQKYLDIASNEKHICYNNSFIAGRVEMTVEVRKKISQRLVGENNGMYRHIYTDDEKQKRRERMLGCKNPLYGKIRSRTHIERNRLSNIGKHDGNKNPTYDPTIYHLHNKNTNETFTGTKYEFISTYKLKHSNSNVYAMFKRKLKSAYGWSLISHHDDSYLDQSGRS